MTAAAQEAAKRYTVDERRMPLNKANEMKKNLIQPLRYAVPWLSGLQAPPFTRSRLPVDARRWVADAEDAVVIIVQNAMRRLKIMHRHNWLNAVLATVHIRKRRRRSKK